MTSVTSNLIPTQPLSTMALFRTTCKLYAKSLPATLPLSLVAIFLLGFFLFLPSFFPTIEKNMTTMVAMIGILLLIPVIGALWLIQIDSANNKPIHYGALLGQAYQKLLTLFGCLISICFIPAFIVLILLLVIASILFLGDKHWIAALLDFKAHHALFSILAPSTVLGLILLASVNAKLFAPPLIFNDNCDAESAIDATDTLLKNQHIKTYLFHLYGFAILVFAYWVPYLIQMLFPQIKSLPQLQQLQSFPLFSWIPLIVSGLLIGLLLPWTLSFWLVRLWDLKARA